MNYDYNWRIFGNDLLFFMRRRGPRGMEICGIYRSLRVQHESASGCSEKEEEERKIAGSLPELWS